MRLNGAIFIAVDLRVQFGDKKLCAHKFLHQGRNKDKNVIKMSV
jgi:hypothetical protein